MSLARLLASLLRASQTRDLAHQAVSNARGRDFVGSLAGLR